MAGDVDHIVCRALQFGCAQEVEFLQGVAVGVEDSGRLVRVYLVNLPLYGFQEPCVFDGRINGNFPLGFHHVVRIVDVDSEHCFDPVSELGHFLAGKLVPTSSYAHHSIVAEGELSVLEAPAVVLEPLLLVANGLARLHVLQLQTCR